MELTAELRTAYYEHIHKPPVGRYKYCPRWRGRLVIKYPQDMILYAQAIWKHRPDYIIETGTWFAGTALFFGDMMLLSGGRKVITIDINSKHQPPHPFVKYVEGSSTDPKIFESIKNRVQEGESKVMVVLDSDHSKEHVAEEMRLYSDIVTSGQYLVVEDCWTSRKDPYPPYYAVQEFLKTDTRFKLKHPEDQFVFAVSSDGWLLKK